MHVATHHWRPDVSYKLDDLLAPDFGRNVTCMTPTACQPYPEGLGKRFAAPAPRQGHTDVIYVTDDMHVLLVDWIASPDQRVCRVWEEMLDPGWGWLYFRLEGDSENDVNSNAPLTLSSPSICLSVLPPHSAQRWRDDTSVSRRGVSIAFRPSAIASRLGELFSDCPVPLKHWATHGSTAYHTSDIPLQPIMNSATRALFDLPFEGQLRHRFVCATAEQLMCLGLAALARRSGEGVLPMQLSPKDRKSLEAVRTALEERLLDPPGTAELARLAGMNRNKLLYGFKHLFGKTISEYTHGQRMLRAHELLLDSSGMTVTDVAASVGYAHVSNFTTAFKRHFGCSPSRLQAPVLKADA